MEGFLNKQNSRKKWQKRFVKLSNMVMIYWKNPQSTRPQGFIQLDTDFDIISINETTFSVICPNKNYTFSGGNANEIQMWIDAITAVKSKSKAAIRQRIPRTGTFLKVSGTCANKIQERYFELENFTLSYSKTKDSKSLNEVSLLCKFEVNESDPTADQVGLFPFTLTTPLRVFKFLTDTTQERRNWMSAIRSWQTFEEKSEEEEGVLSTLGSLGTRRGDLFMKTPGVFGSKWQNRLVVIQDGKLAYYNGKNLNTPLGTILLHDFTVASDPAPPPHPGYCCFSLRLPGRQFIFASLSSHDRTQWMEHLEAARGTNKAPAAEAILSTNSLEASSLYIEKLGLTEEPATNKLTISIALRNIPAMDRMTASDPLVLVYLRDDDDDDWRVLYKSELVINDNNAKFVTPLSLDYALGKPSQLRFNIFDVDDYVLPQASWRLNDIGEVYIDTTTLVSRESNELVFPISLSEGVVVEGTNPPVLHLTINEIPDNASLVNFNMKANDLTTGSKLSSSSQVYLELYRQTETGSLQVVHRTEAVKAGNGVWKPFSVPYYYLTNASPDWPLVLEVIHYSSSQDHEVVSRCRTNFSKLVSAEDDIPLFKVSKSGGKAEKIGSLAANVVLDRRFSFLDYLNGGLKLSLTVAVDMSLHSGDRQDRSSMHFVHGSGSKYTLAMSAVLPMLLPFCQGPKKAIAFGCSDGVNELGPVTQAADIIQPYTKMLDSGVTGAKAEFAPVIAHASGNLTDCTQEEQVYDILLVFTAGEVDDFELAQQAIINASEKPISVIFVSLGEDVNGCLSSLDADGTVVEAMGRKAIRDIVQVVEMGSHKNSHALRILGDVFEEMPEQVTEYMRLHQLTPLFSA